MLIELIRKEIKKSGKPLNQIEKESGVNRSILCRINQGGSCKAETVDALLRYFGFEIRRRKKRRVK